MTMSWLRGKTYVGASGSTSQRFSPVCSTHTTWPRTGTTDRSAASSRAPSPEQFTTTSGPVGSAFRFSRVIVPPSSSTRPASQGR